MKQHARLYSGLLTALRERSLIQHARLYSGLLTALRERTFDTTCKAIFWSTQGFKREPLVVHARLYSGLLNTLKGESLIQHARLYSGPLKVLKERIFDTACKAIFWSTLGCLRQRTYDSEWNAIFWSTHKEREALIQHGRLHSEGLPKTLKEKTSDSSGLSAEIALISASATTNRRVHFRCNGETRGINV